MKAVLGTIVVLGVIGFLVFVAYPGMKKDDLLRQQLDKDLVNQYCGLVQAESYGEAYDQCMGQRFKESVSSDKYLQSQQQRASKMGRLLKWEFLDANVNRNLFTDYKEVQIYYSLQYEKAEDLGWITLTDEDGSWKVQGTFDHQLNIMVW